MTIQYKPMLLVGVWGGVSSLYFAALLFCAPNEMFFENDTSGGEGKEHRVVKSSASLSDAAKFFQEAYRLRAQCGLALQLGSNECHLLQGVQPHSSGPGVKGRSGALIDVRYVKCYTLHAFVLL